MARNGKIIETQRSSRKLSFEWQIPNFFRWAKRNGRYQRTVPNYPRSSRTTKSWLSPTISFCNDLWDLNMCIDGQDDRSACFKLIFYSHHVEGDDRYNYREDDDTYRTICYAFAIKNAGGEAVMSIDCEQDFTPGGHPSLSWAYFWPLSWLTLHKSTLVPGNVFTIVATFQGQKPRISLPHQYHRVWEGGKPPPTKAADFTLKSGSREWPVHKRILAKSSEYFASMFGREWSENSEGWVRFDDIQEDVLDFVLMFAYSGAIEDLLLERVWDIYTVADKLLFGELKRVCIEAIQEEMGPDMVWDALAVAEIHGEKDLRKNALKYLGSRDVWNACLTGWKQFQQNHPSIAAEVLEEIKPR